MRKLIAVLILFVSITSFAQEVPDVSVKVLTSHSIVPVGGEFALFAEYTIPKGVHLTENFLELVIDEQEGFNSGLIQMTDGIFEKGEVIRRGKALLKLPVFVAESLNTGNLKLKVSASFQVCTEGDSPMCFPPKFKKFEFDIQIAETGTEYSPNPDANNFNEIFSITVDPAPSAEKDLNLAERLEKALVSGSILAYLFVFIGGFLTSLTPCVYPMIPITIAYIGGRSAGGGKWKGFTLSLFYVLGLAIIYSLLGVLAALSGSLFGSFAQTPAVLAVVAGIFTLMGLSMLGLFDLALPASLQGKLQGKGPRSGYFGSIVMGMVAGLVAAPCAGPIIVALLVYISTTGKVVLGFTLMMAFAFGMGLLFIALGTFSGLLNSMPSAGMWMDKVKKTFGIAMIGAAIWIVKPLLPPPAFGILVGLSLVLLGSVLGAFKKLEDSSTMAASLFKGLAVLSFAMGTYFVVILLPVPGKIIPEQSIPNSTQVSVQDVWQSDLNAALASAKSEDKRIILDFGAEWCAQCKELEHKTFSDPTVIAKLKEMIPVKVDCTDSRDPDVRKIQKQYGVRGLPTVIVLDSEGYELARFMSFLSAKDFKKFIEEVEKQDV